MSRAGLTLRGNAAKLLSALETYKDELVALGVRVDRGRRIARLESEWTTYLEALKSCSDHTTSRPRRPDGLVWKTPYMVLAHRLSLS